MDQIKAQRQEMFDQAVRGVLGQGRASIKGARCAYLGQDLGDNGQPCRCAIGHVLTPGELEAIRTNGYNGSSMRDVIIHLGAVSPVFDRFKIHKDFICELQACHDVAETQARKALRTIGADGDSQLNGLFLTIFVKKATYLALCEGLDLAVLQGAS